MTQRRYSPLHDLWHRRVEGQIRDAIYSHPEWFSFRSEREKRTCVNSLAKRIVGEIVAAYAVATLPDAVARNCVGPVAAGGVVEIAASREGGGGIAAPLLRAEGGGA